MRKSIKIVLTIISGLAILNLLTFVFPSTILKLFPNIETVNYVGLLVNGLNLLNIIVSIRYLKSFNTIKKEKKNSWIFYLIFFNPIAFPVLLWIKEEK